MTVPWQRLAVEPIFMQELAMAKSPPRAIDHLVLPVKDIAGARARYEALGFTVAPDGLHPFGTENCCIFIADGTFLEPLGIAHRETCEAAALQGNSFIRNDQAYRFRIGDEGFSHLVVKSDDAKADDAFYKQSGMSGGEQVQFSRTFEAPDGESGEISFELAFTADQRSPDSHFFACQFVSPVKADRSALQTHANGVICMNEVIATEVNPTDFQYFFQMFLNQRHMDADSFGMSFKTQNATVTVLTPDGARAFYGIETDRQQRGMQLEGFVLGVSDLGAVQAHFEDNGINFRTRGKRLIVPPAPGQGATIVFEAD